MLELPLLHQLQVGADYCRACRAYSAELSAEWWDAYKRTLCRVERVWTLPRYAEVLLKELSLAGTLQATRRC